MPNFDFYIWTDGACSGKTLVGGHGTMMTRSTPETNEDEIEVIKEEYQRETGTTNNVQELKGMLKALEWVSPPFKYQILSDSAYVVNMCNDWIYSWRDNGWTRGGGKPIKNLMIVKQIFEQLEKKRAFCMITHVKGHAGIGGNEYVDRRIAEFVGEAEE